MAPAAGRLTSRMFSPMVRPSSSSASVTTWFRSMISTWEGSRLANSSSWPVSDLARPAALRILARSSAASPATSSDRKSA
jgi:hypothetical protein